MISSKTCIPAGMWVRFLETTPCITQNVLLDACHLLLVTTRMNELLVEWLRRPHFSCGGHNWYRCMCTSLYCDRKAWPILLTGYERLSENRGAENWFSYHILTIILPVTKLTSSTFLRPGHRGLAKRHCKWGKMINYFPCVPSLTGIIFSVNLTKVSSNFF